MLNRKLGDGTAQQEKNTHKGNRINARQRTAIGSCWPSAVASGAAIKNVINMKANILKRSDLNLMSLDFCQLHSLCISKMTILL